MRFVEPMMGLRGKAPHHLRAAGGPVCAYAASALMAVVGAKELVRLGSFQHQLKATVLGAALLASAAVVVYPAAAFPAVLALAPFEFPIKLAGFHAGSNEVLLLALALALAPRLRVGFAPRWVVIGFALLISGSFATAAVAADQQLALWGAVRWLAVGVLSLAAFQMLNSKRDLDLANRCAEIISVTSIIVAAFALLQRVGIYWIVGPPYASGRVDSSFGYYTNFAGYMMVAVLVATGSAIDAARRRNGLRLGLHSLAALASGVGLGISLSRGALGGAAVGVIVMIGLNARSPRNAIRVVAIVLAFGSIAWLVVPASTRSDFAQRLTASSLNAGTDYEHAALPQIGLTALESHSLGLGYGNFPQYLERSGRVESLDKTYFHAHRLPVQVGLDSGWIGLAGFALLVAAPLIAAAEAARRKRLTPTAGAFTAALVAFLAQGWYDYLFDETAFLIIFVALLWAVWQSTRTALA